MKKIFMILAAALLCMSMSAKDLTGIKFYVNPGHGSFGPNDRPMATIPYPNLPTTGMPDTCGFYESNTNMWKCLYLGAKLEAMGAEVMYSHTECGPWPYEKKNGDYPDYTYNKNGSIANPEIGWQYTDGYYCHPEIEKYNRNLVEITQEVEANNIDYFISVHSNANTDGSTANFPLMLYRGPDSYSTANSVDGADYVEGSYEKAKACNEEKLKIMKAGIDVPSSTALNIRGDWNFYGSHSGRTHANGKTYQGYLGVLKHGASGFLSEGYFHTYQPARHRALNQDYCHMEGLDYYRGIINYYGADKETVGYIVGTVKDSLNKISHKLFQYQAKTNDQWVPCNGAEVILKKGGKEVARYNVDTCYNGLFIFKNLEPGDDYSLEASCDGFFPLEEQYKKPFSVKANETSYRMIYLLDTSWVAPEIAYEDYPNPNQPAHLCLPSVFEMKQDTARSYTKIINGTIKRIIPCGDSTIILSHDTAKVAHIYLVKNNLMNVDTLSSDKIIDTISTQGIIPSDPDNAGDYLALSDIALTCDGKLVGVNYVRCQYDDGQVDAGYKRGVKNFYIWDSLPANPRVWFTANDAGNSYRNDGGYTLAVKGKSEDCQVIVSQRHYNATTGGALRISSYTVTDGVASYIFYGKTLNAEAPLHAAYHGEDIQFTLSPRSEKNDFIFDAGLVTPMEFRLPSGQNQDVTILGTIPAELMHVKFNGATYFKYAGHSLMAAPTTDTLGRVTGVQVLDITDGLDKAVVVKTTKTKLDTTITTNFAAVSAKVNGKNLSLYLITDTIMYSFTSVGVKQPITANIMAFNLAVEDNDSAYAFTFDATEDVKNANLVFYNKGGYVAGKVAINAAKGANKAIVAKKDIPGKAGQVLTWAVELEGLAISDFIIVASDNSLIESGTSRLFNAVSTNPELDNFGNIYIMHRAGSSSSAAGQNSGIWEFDHNLAKQNTEVYKGGVSRFGNPTRMSMDREGYLYIADWADGYSGIYLANTADMTQPFTQFFAGTRESNGAFNNNGVYTGSSTPGCHVYDNGEEVKLFVYNEDAKGTLPENGMAVYNIGQEDGTILHKWETAPSKVYTLTGQANTEGNPWGTSHGFFVSQVRTSGNNNSGATSLKFYSNDGAEQMSSASDEYKEIITGSNAGGYVVSADESVMVFNDGDQQFLVFDITWEGDKPVLALRYTIKHGIAAIRQMNWDYAGNIVCSGDNGIHIVALPTEENITVVPAKKALTVTCPGTAVPVTGVTLNKDSMELIIEEVGTLTYTITPEDATDNFVKWTSSDKTIALVNNGIVTAVSIGTATITATTIDGGFTATCQVTVKPRPVTGVTLDKAEVTLEVKETATLVATIAPANATNKDVTWTSDNTAVATVANGVITAVAVGTANITVTTVDGNFKATCAVTVNPISVKGVTLNKTTMTLKVAQADTLVATLTPEDAANKEVVWASDNAEVATVVDGVVTAVALGTANITVTTVDGNFTATCVVTVEATPVTGVTLDVTELTLDVPQTATLKATVAPEDATDKSVTWASDNETVATVAEGVVTAMAEGTANITVTTTDGGFKATCVVTVRIVDGVMNIQVLDVNAPMYDVLGRQVDNTYRGIVIQNGQKFMLQ